MSDRAWTLFPEPSPDLERATASKALKPKPEHPTKVGSEAAFKEFHRVASEVRAEQTEEKS